jgi:hypothetical protein
MRAVVGIIAAVALAGCGAAREQPSADVERPVKASSSPEVLYFFRVLGDDPVPDTVSLHADGTALVKRIAGRGWKDIQVVLSPAEAHRVIRLARRAPFERLDGRTVTPGGFGGSDNGMRYMLRRDRQSVTVADGDIPRSFRALVRLMNGIVEGDVGHQGAEDRHYSANGGVATEG